MKLGILGGGQLARMLSMSAHPLGMEVICVDPNPDCSAKNITKVVNANFSDIHAIQKYFSGVDCITYESENLPIDAVNLISRKFKIHPQIDALKIFQDRFYEKEFLNSLQIPTVEYININEWSDIENAAKKLAFPFLIKTRLSGYDGKGQIKIHNIDEAKKAWQNLSGKKLIAEKLINFDFEISLISVRNSAGELVFYPLILNQHKNGILYMSQAPYFNEKFAMLAQKYAALVLQKLDYVGVMTIEFFCLNDTLLVNEVAPRVHNSGHWTIEGAETSQFENHIRAIMDLPLGSPKAKSQSAMLNFIGKKQNMEKLLTIPGAHYHWYNKEPLDGRKLGHLTLCAPNKKQIKINVKKAIKLINS